MILGFLLLSLHKISCISAKQPSKLVDFALDLHYLCKRQEDSHRHAKLKKEL